MFIFFYKLGQTLGSLTLVKPNMQSLLVLLASCLAESPNTPHREFSVTNFEVGGKISRDPDSSSGKLPS